MSSPRPHRWSLGPHAERHRPLPAATPTSRRRRCAVSSAPAALGKSSAASRERAARRRIAVSLWSMSEQGSASTRAIHAGLPDPAQGEPLLAGPVLAAPYHLRGPADAAPYGYGRDAEPDLDAPGGRARRARGRRVGRRSRPAWRRCPAVLAPRLRPRRRARRAARRLPGRPLAGRGAARAAAASRCGSCPPPRTRSSRRRTGATLVWVETPANPGLDVCDIAAVAAAAHAAGALVGGRQHASPRRSASARSTSAPTSHVSARTKSLAGHSDLLLGAVSVRDAGAGRRAAALALARRRDPRPVRGLAAAPLAGHARAAARAPERQRARRRPRRSRAASTTSPPRTDGHPGHAAPRARCAASARWSASRCRRRQAQAFLGALELVAEATSFGGVALDRRAARPLGHRRGARGLHPLLGRLRGHRGPRRRRRAGARVSLRRACHTTKTPHVRCGPFADEWGRR